MPVPSFARRHGFAASLVLGAMAATGFAPLDWWPVTLVSIAVWIWLVHEAPGMWPALNRGWGFGLAHLSVGNAWIQHAFTFQDAMPQWLGYAAVVLLCTYLAVYPMLAAGLAWRLAGPRAAGDRTTRPGAAFVLVFGAAWIVTEWLRGTMLTGYPWNPLAAIWLPAIGIAQLARFVGTYALSGLTVVAAGAVLLALHRRLVLPAVAAVVVGVAWLTGSSRPEPAAAAPHVVIVQPDLGEEERPTGNYAENNLAAIEALLPRRETATAPRLILLPEGAIRFYLEDGYPPEAYLRGSAATIRQRIAHLLNPGDIVLTGASGLVYDRTGMLRAATNSVYAVNSAGRLAGRYDKAHLVPWGEYLPMRPLMSAIGLQRLVPGDLDFRPGPGPRALALAGFGQIGVQLCYEIIFSGEVVDRAHRPAVIFNPSNDSWYGDQGPAEHLAMARLRAIEEGLPILRATPTGISAVIDANGVLLGTVGLHRAGVIDMAVPAAHPPTLFARTGNRMVAIMALALAALAVAIRRRAR